MQLDWTSLATQLLDELKEAAFVLDPGGRVMLANAPAAVLFERYNDALSGIDLIEDCLFPEDADKARADVREALDREGMLSWRIRTPRGKRLLLRADARPLQGKRASHGVIVRVRAVNQLPAVDSLSPCPEYAFTIATSGENFGRVESVQPGQALPNASGGQETRCHAALYGRKDPCPECPAKDKPGPDNWNLRVFPHPKEPDVLVIAAARVVGDGEVAVSETLTTTELLGKLIDARVAQVARRAGLSSREQEVLAHLALGRSYADIAMILEIAERTVRFHVGNVLNKLGADSRVDILRAIL